MNHKIIDHPGADVPFHTVIETDGAEWGEMPGVDGRFLIKPAEGKTPADYGIKGKEGAENVRRAAVAKAIKSLSPDDKDAWNADGTVSVTNLEKLLDDKSVSQEDVDAVAPGLTRDKVIAAAAHKPSKVSRNKAK